MSRGKILIVEDEFVVAENLGSDLDSMGHEVIGLVSSGEEALEIARREKPDLVLMDIKLLGRMDGVEAAIQLRQELDVPVLFLTAFADENILERAKLAEPLGYLVKPYERKGLRASIEMAHYKARMERLLRESESRFRSMFENSPVAYLALDESDRCLDVNSELCELLGYGREELIGRHFVELCPPEMRHLCLEQFAKFSDKGRLQTELELLRKDNAVLTVSMEGRLQCDIDGRYVRRHCIMHNITERKRIEEERLQLVQWLQQFQKAESLARMAGAIAHHCNNMLAAVMGNLELALNLLPAESESRDFIAEAMKASSRTAEIGRFMLTYLGQTIGKKERIDLAEAAGKAHALLSTYIPGNIHLETGLLPQGPMIKADGAHIQQILTNLLCNAVEAIGESEGQITMAVEAVTAEEIRRVRFFPMDWTPKEKNYACLSVTDTGPGLDAAIVEKIFDPFFTTRFMGRGLGLPVVLGLMKTYEGAITVESRPGERTSFRVYFPIPEQEEMPAPGEAPVFPQIEGGQLVLVVDDEPLVRSMARSMLEEIFGYKVITAANGFEAVDIFRARKSEIDLVLLDLTMPGMNGWETLAELRALQPGIPAILSSGYDEAQVMQETHSERPQAFLHKPYQSSDLKAALGAAQHPPTFTK